MSRIELVIFDCDGVLVDSEPIGNLVLGASLREASVPVDDETVASLFRGWAMTSVVAWAEREHGRALGAEFLTRFQDHLFRALRHGIVLMPGAAETLAALRLPVCVASSGEPDKMRLSLGLTGLLGRFDGRLFSATQVPRGKPAPDLFLFASRAMGVEPERAAVVEDSLAGVEAAIAAGMTVFGYAPEAEHDCSHRQQLAAAGAKPLNDLRDLPRHVATGG